MMKMMIGDDGDDVTDDNDDDDDDGGDVIGNGDKILTMTKIMMEVDEQHS